MYLWIAVVAGLAVIAWQDFRDRAVYAWLFPLLCVLAVAHAVDLGVFSLYVLVANLIIVAGQLALLNLVMYWRTRKWLMHGEQWIGWGDLACFAVLACCFSTVNFVLFYVASLIIVLLAALVTMAMGFRTKHVPLAGGQAVLLAMVLLADYAHRGKRLHTDIDIMQFIQ
ncbi:hypothetical protein [Parapedobacter sp. DT-150]|uniref:hypothetical protein n=1 Tax=Parapedobacter sp. DT-150 TaxID=3396162 RepID=UPI003F1944C3